MTKKTVSSRSCLVALALLFTLANVPKPLTVDDAAYYYFARQFALDPLRPYDFEMFWYQWPAPANEVLAPPVLPFWWSLGIRLFGERPWLWKLWLLPFAWLFVVGLHALFRRFARGLELPLLVLTVLSPAFLPSFNLMLDIPALALGLTALNLFFRACGRGSLTRAALTGLAAGLALQTKYSALLVPMLMLLYALLLGRWRLGLVAAGVAVSIFAAWESYVAVRHGQSHFLANIPKNESWTEWFTLKQLLASALLPILGGLTPALTLVGLAALGAPRALLLATGALLAAGYVVVAAVDVPFSPELWEFAGIVRPLEQAIFGLMGVLNLAVVLVAAWSASVDPHPACQSEALQRRLHVFLLLWLLLEIAGYFALSPFPAVRRCLGLVVVCTLLVGRLAAREIRPVALVGGVVYGAALGLLFWTVDLVDAYTPKNAVATAADVVAFARQPGQSVWYVGHWGFQFYAEGAGMKPVVPDRSVLRPGDWLVVPDGRWEQQRIQVDPEATHYESQLLVRPALTLRTVQCYYGGYAPLEHHAGPRMRVTIYRVTALWVPASDLR